MVYHPDHPKRPSVYYDDSCVLCEGAAAKIRHDIGLETRGASGDLPAVINKDELMHDVHAIDENGTVHKGVDAIIMILRWHPTWFWIAPIVAFPGIKHIVGAGYRVVAQNRHRWFGKKI